MSINRVNISGNLTRDPELRMTGGGTQILSFGVAVNDRRRNPQTNEWEDVPNFVDCVVFGARAEPLSRFLSKGQKVAVEGKLRYSSWETKDGQRRSKLEVIVDEIDFMSPRGQQGGGAGGYQQPAPSFQQGPSYAAPAPQGSYAPQAQAAPQPVQTPPSADVYDEDIPF
ncbi:single-stranded DNA-binding protein [Olsenella sp. An290]|uniref:single-stranded DNA-binding protein n=1 Tax=Olsenella sp. An290 TaxID=1965625 RepID=UPI000B36B935|nr:single-stranded DNA-binding protein [Olsenella sp. An290]OUO34478.1 single-stranded DNA-binding protein [Olsenella sp. An290]